MWRFIWRFLAVAFVGLAISGCVSTTPMQEKADLTRGPDSESIVPVYQEARQCLRGLPNTPKLRLAVSDIVDRTGKISISSGGGTGHFVPQSGMEMAISSLDGVGLKLVEVGSSYRTLVDWYEAKKTKRLAGDGLKLTTTVVTKDGPKEKRVDFLPPKAGSVGASMVTVYGSITHLDFLPGGGAEIRIAGIGPSIRQHRILVGIDLRAVTMPYPTQLGGDIIATASLMKQVVAVETEFGVASFLGTNNYFSFRVGEQKREALQFALRTMIERTMLELVSKVLDPKAKHNCLDILKTPDTFVSGENTGRNTKS